MIGGRFPAGWRIGLRGDAGSATVWVLATGIVLVLAAVAFAMAGAATVVRHRAQAAADLAALAGALLAGDGEEAACQRAADVSARNGARLVDCRLEGFDVVVAVEVASARVVGFGVARGAARAGPVEDSSTAGVRGQVGQGQVGQEVQPVRQRLGESSTQHGGLFDHTASRQAVLQWQDAQRPSPPLGTDRAGLLAEGGAHGAVVGHAVGLGPHGVGDRWRDRCLHRAEAAGTAH